jgi:hypothetical protein
MGVKSNNVKFNDIKFGPKPNSGLRDDFNATTLDTSVWTITSQTGYTVDYNFTVSSGELVMQNTTSNNLYNSFAGIYTNQKFPVGTRAIARVKHTTGQHGTFLGFANNPDSIAGHANTNPAISWYGRSLTGGSALAGETTVGSYKDELGATDYTQYTDVDHRSYYELEIHRVSSSVVDFKIDGVLKHQVTGITFAEDYSVFLGTDAYSPSTELIVDYVEIILP